MYKNKFQILLAIMVLMVSVLACNASYSSAKITDAYMTANSDGSGKTSVFSGDQTFYCIVIVANAPEDTSLKAVWTAVNVAEVDPGLVLDEVEITTNGQNEFTFNLQNDMLWPMGTYKVDVYMNDKLEQTLEFQVQ